MTHRPHGNINVSSTDVLIAMLTHDLRGSWSEGTASRSREHIDPAGSGPLPAVADTLADTLANTEDARAAVEPAEPKAPTR